MENTRSHNRGRLFQKAWFTFLAQQQLACIANFSCANSLGCWCCAGIHPNHLCGRLNADSHGMCSQKLVHTQLQRMLGCLGLSIRTNSALTCLQVCNSKFSVRQYTHTVIGSSQGNPKFGKLEALTGHLNARIGLLWGDVSAVFGMQGQGNLFSLTHRCVAPIHIALRLVNGVDHGAGGVINRQGGSTWQAGGIKGSRTGMHGGAELGSAAGCTLHTEKVLTLPPMGAIK